MSYAGPLQYVGPGAVPMGGDPLAPIYHAPTRQQLIGQLANALRRAGYYAAEDVLLIRSWLESDKYTLDEIEQVLAAAKLLSEYGEK